MRKVLLGIFSAVNIAVLVWLCVTSFGKELQPRMLASIDNPKPTVEAFMDAFKNREFDKSAKYVSNYSSLGEDIINSTDAAAIDAGASAEDSNDSAERISAYLYDRLFESYDMEFIDNSNVHPITGSVVESDYTVNGRSATVSVKFTVFDTNKFSERMTEEVTSLAKKSQFEGVDIDTDEKAYNLIEQAFNKVEQESSEDFITTAVIDVDLVYVDKQWKIYMDEDFYNALMGDLSGFEDAVSGSDVVSNTDTEVE